MEKQAVEIVPANGNVLANKKVEVSNDAYALSISIDKLTAAINRLADRMS